SVEMLAAIGRIHDQQLARGGRSERRTIVEQIVAVMNENRPRPRVAVERDYMLKPDRADGNPPHRMRRAVGQPDTPSAIRQQPRIAVTGARPRLPRRPPPT